MKQRTIPARGLKPGDLIGVGGTLWLVLKTEIMLENPPHRRMLITTVMLQNRAVRQYDWTTAQDTQYHVVRS